VPGLPDVKRARADAEDGLKHPPPRPFPWKWATAAVALLSAGGYALLWLARWRRNRFRVTAAAVASMLEAGTTPVFLDVRQEAAARRSGLAIPGARYIAPDALERGNAVVDVERDRTIVAYCT
jgi:hypothetical protein